MGIIEGRRGVRATRRVQGGIEDGKDGFGVVDGRRAREEGEKGWESYAEEVGHVSIGPRKRGTEKRKGRERGELELQGDNPRASERDSCCCSATHFIGGSP